MKIQVSVFEEYGCWWAQTQVLNLIVRGDTKESAVAKVVENTKHYLSKIRAIKEIEFPKVEIQEVEI